MNETDELDAPARSEDPAAPKTFPSAKSHDPTVAHTPGRRRVGLLNHPARWFASLVCLVVIAALAAVGFLERGGADRFLETRARQALQEALGPDLDTAIARAGVRISRSGTIELAAEKVRVSDSQTSANIASADSISVGVAALPLLQGRVEVTALNVDGVTVDATAFGSATPFDLDSFRIDAIGAIAERVFAGADRMVRIVRRRETGQVRVSNLRIEGGKGRRVIVPRVVLSRSGQHNIVVDADLVENDGVAHLRARVRSEPGSDRVSVIDLKLDDLDTTPLLLQTALDGTPKVGIATKADIAVTAKRRTGDDAPTLGAQISLDRGLFYADGVAAALKQSTFSLSYLFDRKSIEIDSSRLKVGDSVFPLQGGLIDLSNLDDAEGRGFAIDVVVDDGVAAPVDSDEPPLPFNAKLFGRYLKDSRTLNFDRMAVSSPRGSLAASLQVERGSPSPEVSFSARIGAMETTAVKQLWPFWLAKRGRQWVLENLYGGSVSNASISVFIPKGLIAERRGRLDLGPGQLKLDFDYQNARLNVAGDIPPLRDTAGHLRLRGHSLDVGLAEGTAYFPTGRSVDVSKGHFRIPHTDAHPLMAELDLSVSGKADAVAELISYRPIDALERTKYRPEDFSGTMASHVTARFGLIRGQDPPKPDWRVEAELQGVDVGPKVEGRTFQNLEGQLTVDPDKAILDSDASVDGIAMHLALTEPLEAGSKPKDRVITARLDAAARKKLAPALNTLLSGPVDIKLVQAGTGQAVDVDLTDATLSLPWIGWSKGAGIAAHASFDANQKDDVLSISDFTLDGDGFDATGSLTIDGSTLTRARFPSIELSSRDNYALDLKRDGGGYQIDVNGKAIDLRSLIDRIKNPARSGSGDGARTTIRAQIDTAYGFNDERLSGVTATYSGRGGEIDSLDLKGVTSGGEALVTKIASQEGARTVELSCGDGGALARFLAIYSKIRGGLLNVRLRQAKNGPYRGTVDLRAFNVVGEEKLDSLVSAPTGAGGSSLRDTANKDFDLNRAQFDRAFARIAYSPNGLSVGDGILRGVSVGSTFQGTVFDSAGNMNLTGTFMPAYGLNSLFSNIPLLGAILGNGRDRGLIGITFRLTGKAASPKLEVNPLSAIAPGVFRQIFEY